MAATQRGSLIPQCTPLSILKSLTDLASVGLEPGTGPTAMAYLVPFRAGSQWEAQQVIGYRGYIALARRSGLFQDLHATVVHQKDTFRIRLGSNPEVEHTPYIGDGSPGEVVGAYCVARFTTGGTQIEFMSLYEIKQIRDKHSKSAARGGPWRDNFEAMATKTVIRKAAKHWPLSAELEAAITMDAVTPQGQVIDATVEFVGDTPEAAIDVDAADTDGEPEADDELATAQARARALVQAQK